ncbi:MAG TPA: phosphatidylserine/phosphatidylglycerophosphate/cardiolipin synthase family protein [Gemmatimonadaceae bacterium]
MSGRPSRTKTHPVETAPPPVTPPALPPGGGPSFSRALWRMTSADVSEGNSVALFSDGATTFEAMIDMIDGAERTVALECYILRSDAVGMRFAVALARAAKRGVEVRLLADWFGMLGIKSSYLRNLRRRGVHIRVFNPPGIRPWLGAFPRDHRKLLVVDSWAGITGGIGIGDEWQGGIVLKRRLAWRDTCIRLVGPAAKDLTRAFDHMWSRAAGERPPRAERKLIRAPRGAGLDPAAAAPSVVGIVEGEPWRLRVGRALHLQAAAAQRSIWVASAYFVPSFAEVEALNGAARDGVDVRLLVPSRYDHPWLHGLTARFYKRLLRNGVRIWEWRGEMMHAKTTVVDGRWTRVGSTDFNPLGVAINFELDAIVEDPRVGAAAEAMFENDLSRSREIRLRGRTARAPRPQ